MSRADTRVWRRFLARGSVSFNRLDYDVSLGGKGAAAVPSSSDYYGMWAQLMKKRVDVVGWVSGQVWIIEVKPVANLAALGQVLAYRFLYNEERRPRVETLPIVVCGSLDADLGPVYDYYGVQVLTAAG